MSNFYYIEGDDECAYFRANVNRLRQALDGDGLWALRMLRKGIPASLGGDWQVRRRALIFQSKIEEHGEHFFIARGTLYFCYRVEAVNENVSRIVPLGKMSLGRKIAVPCQLLTVFVIGVIFTPLGYLYWNWEIKRHSKDKLRSFCHYLELKVTGAIQ
jgi:hypothetical protein